MPEQPAERLARFRADHPLWWVRPHPDRPGFLASRRGRSQLWAPTLTGLADAIAEAEQEGGGDDA